VNSASQIERLWATIAKQTWLFHGCRNILEQLAEVDLLDGETLRVTPRRRVFRIEGKPRLVVKHYVHRTLTKRLRMLFKGTPAMREWSRLEQARRVGLPVPQPYGYAQDRKIFPRQSVLVMEHIEGTIEVKKYLYGHPQTVPNNRWRVIHALAVLLRRAHDAGVRQRDLHLGNFLVRVGAVDLEIFLIDMAAVKFGASLTARMRWQDLAVLRGGTFAASATDALRFFRGYLAAPGKLSADGRTLAWQLERAGWAHRLSLWRKRTKRPLANNRDFVRIDRKGFKGFAWREEWAQKIDLFTQGPASLLARANVVKDSRTTTVGMITVAGKDVFLKRYNCQGLGYMIKNAFRSSRAKRVWKLSHNCRLRGVPVALPLAYLERRQGRKLVDSYLMTAAVRGPNLKELLAATWSTPRTKREWMGALARQMRRMHDRGMSHRDLKAENLIAQRSDQGQWKFYIVDFDGLRSRSVSWRRRLKNIARLARDCASNAEITAADQVRFLKCYLGDRETRQWRKRYRQLQRIAGRLRRARRAFSPRSRSVSLADRKIPANPASSDMAKFLRKHPSKSFFRL
jgi:tRNA A-37 threonylcarbamoyl transferase component Bud32